MNNISEQQIETLYDFTRKHYVEYFDLQTELVDHLAHGIEAQWAVNDSISFDDALNVEFKKFGVFGFTQMVEKRQQAMNKRYNKIMWNHFLGFIFSPKIFVILAVFGLCLLLAIKIPFGPQIVYAVGGITYFAFIIISSINFKRYRSLTQKTDKKRWLLEEQINRYGSGTAIFFVPYYFYVIMLSNGESWSSGSLFFTYLIPFCVSLTLTVCYIAYVEIPELAKKYLKETYPEYELAT